MTSIEKSASRFRLETFINIFSGANWFTLLLFSFNFPTSHCTITSIYKLEIDHLNLETYIKVSINCSLHFYFQEILLQAIT